ncbi:MAG TPA: hydrogenase expression/formation protein HypE [Terriglobia bacterium]|nr:hydrogenase expression/formation protein HypE [Terriglobia bacterium]
MIRETHITLAHGSGGRATRDLIQHLFLEHFSNPQLAALEDYATIGWPPGSNSRLVFSTDSYVVKPIIFPGGDIGRLAVHGTVNDVAMSGARPLCISAGFILEEGLAIDVLRRIVQSMAAAARSANVTIVTGDTKVVERGSGDKIFINTSGIGIIESAVALSMTKIVPGDKVILSGTIGDHGTAILIARGELAIESDIESDTACLSGLVKAIIDMTVSSNAVDAIRLMRDPTRGGLATVLNEIASGANCHIKIDEERIPLRPDVAGACELLGLDPLYVANEGKLVVVVAPELAEQVVHAMRQHPLGRESAVIGEIQHEPHGFVAMRTAFGGSRIVDMLSGDQLPRIC